MLFGVSIARAGRLFIGGPTLALGWFLLTLSQIACAEVVTVDGRSVIGKDLGAARQAAVNDAVQNALLNRGGHLDSLTSVQNGMISDNTVHLRASGQVSNVKVLDEYQTNGFYFVTVRAEVKERKSCVEPSERVYGRSVLFTAFPRQLPLSSAVGQLHDVEAELPLDVSRRLYVLSGGTIKAEKSAALAGQTGFLAHGRRTSSVVQETAERHGAQFVVAGSVVDMSMLQPDRYHRQSALGSAGNRTGGIIRGWFGKRHSDNRERAFTMRIVLYDGLSGQVLFDKMYTAQGIWDAHYTATVGFGSPGFWKTRYGKAVDELVDEAVSDLREKINCQPFMLSARLLSGQNAVYLPAGANHGIRAGDSLPLYTQYALERAGYQDVAGDTSSAAAPWGLRNEGVTLTVKETYPSYSVAEPSEQLEVGRRYLVVSW